VHNKQLSGVLQGEPQSCPAPFYCPMNDICSVPTTMTTSPHIPHAYQPQGILAMMEQMNISQPKLKSDCYVWAWTPKILDF